MDIIERLEAELRLIVDDMDIPGADLGEIIVECAKAGDWSQLRELFGEIAAAEWRHAYELDADGFCARHFQIARECRRSFVSNSSRRLAYLSRTNEVPGVNLSPVEEIQRLFDSSGIMFQVAFARRLVDLIEPAADRAAQLRELVVDEATSKEADKYLEEACECYYFGFYSACVVMCRSLLEEALERRLPREILNQWRDDAKAQGMELTLGSLLKKVNNHPRALVPNEFPRLARKVNETATRAAHTEPVTPKDAESCFQNARKALTALLGGDAEGRLGSPSFSE